MTNPIKISSPNGQIPTSVLMMLIEHKAPPDIAKKQNGNKADQTEKEKEQLIQPKAVPDNQS